MYVVNSYISFAIYLAVFLLVTVAVFQWQQSRAVRRRVLRMMLTFGLDEATARKADALLDLDMKAVRRRCRRCCRDAANDDWPRRRPSRWRSNRRRETTRRQ